MFVNDRLENRRNGGAPELRRGFPRVHRPASRRPRDPAARIRPISRVRRGPPRAPRIGRTTRRECVPHRSRCRARSDSPPGSTDPSGSKADPGHERRPRSASCASRRASRRAFPRRRGRRNPDSPR
jgi:hypothetical protein